MFKKVKDKLKNNKALMISLATVLIILIGGVSYAAYDYSFIGKDSKLESGSVSIKFLESNTNVIDLKNALPISDSEGKKGDSFDFAVTTKASYKTGLKYDLSVEKLSVDSGYTSLSDNQVKIYLTDSGNNDLVSPTLISGLDSNKIYSKTNKHSSANTKITDKYKLRVWVDSNVDASNWDQSTKLEYKFKVGLKSEEVEVVAGPNEPVLDNAMIPVYYDESSSSWKKADSSNKDNNWYNYNEKKWANSVTVSSTNRSKYLSASVGTEIPMDDILTMQVWIPRYKYKVWNYNSDGTKTSSPQEIEITWENGTDKTGEISCEDSISGTDGDPSETCKLKSTNATCADATCNGKTYTHPAFTFGDKEIKGFWIGKFEISATTSLDKRTIAYREENNDKNITFVDKISSHSGVNDISIKKLAAILEPDCTILYDGTVLSSCSDVYFALTKPNMHSWIYGKIKLYEDSIFNMKSNGNQYGLSTNTDIYMIKNMEWGAVAYLSHSKYGICTDGTCKEIGINNNSDYLTGCGAVAGSSLSTTCNSYNTKNGMLASTTGNIYGVYDMSGKSEYTMANMVSNDGEIMTSSSSGYINSTYPNNKYYDKYSYSASDVTRIRSKLGDGIKEVYQSSYSWYNGDSYLVYDSYSWFARGGSGIFSSKYFYGGTLAYISTRFIISS